MKLDHLDRTTIVPDVCYDNPCLRGMRGPVVVLLSKLCGGMTYEQILEDHPELEKEDIFAAINYTILILSKKNSKKI